MEAGASMDDAKPQGKAGEEELSMEEILQSIRRIIAEDEKAPGEAPAAPASDVLELTEMVNDDGSVTSLTAEPAGDVLSSIDSALTPEPEIVELAAPEPVSYTPPPAPPVQHTSDDNLLSDEAALAAAASFRKLKSAEPVSNAHVGTPAPPFRSGITVEDLVAEMLRPMLKDWLDKNLPGIVERIVEREVHKLTK